MKYEISSHALSVKGVDAERVAVELERLEQEHNGLTAEIVLQAARRKRSELHKLFEWDDSSAAEKWRMHQARNLIRSVRVTVNDVKQAPARPIFVRTEDVYRPVSSVVQRMDLYISAMEKLQSRVDSAERAVQELRDAAQQEYPDDEDKLSRVNIALEAFRACSKAVQALH